ncbi:hypothetical protein K431DRAFT_291347 [Polychaeton citri CBS 116435]|uniref:Uncharacterized protein n=1 Tax=Polychaeton citri CBS 116435 TaxID=1314669 RepID=A0A9P4UTF8_9PEZI|nr:hypothetical protein K431DRAFT_291347 [Polychaeton citri CBS 116435]
MTSRNRIPPALEAYLRLPPEAALLVFTGTLGCSANWLTSRLVSACLANDNDARHGLEDGGSSAVIFVNFLHDATFWQYEIRRTTGVDIARSMKEGRLMFVDCFTQNTSTIQAVHDAIAVAIAQLQKARPSAKVLLILDNPDTVIALNAATKNEVNKTLLKLRSQVHAAAVVCNADQPLLAAATADEVAHHTPLEVESAAFVSSLAHQARFVMSVRELDTGAARDVSGVVRVSRGGDDGWWGPEVNGRVREIEALYLVQRDGGVKVFERGAVA